MSLLKKKLRNSFKEFPIELYSNNNLIYFEDKDGFWYYQEFNSNNNVIYIENSNGLIDDDRPKKEYTIKEIEEKLGIKGIKIIKE